jgi:hypothetical protein
MRALGSVPLYYDGAGVSELGWWSRRKLPVTKPRIWLLSSAGQGFGGYTVYAGRFIHIPPRVQHGQRVCFADTA